MSLVFDRTIKTFVTKHGEGSMIQKKSWWTQPIHIEFFRSISKWGEGGQVLEVCLKSRLFLSSMKRPKLCFSISISNNISVSIIATFILSPSASFTLPSLGQSRPPPLESFPGRAVKFWHSCCVGWWSDDDYDGFGRSQDVIENVLNILLAPLVVLL